MGCVGSKGDTSIFDVYNPLKDAKLPVIWILGGPGSGKLTQCQMIEDRYEYTHICLEYLLRSEVLSKSETGKIIKRKLAKNELIPIEIELKILKDAMLKKLKTTKGFLIDGYPRNKEQAVAFENEIMPCDMILYFQTTPDILLKRVLKRARHMGTSMSKPEKSAAIRTRIQTFLNNMSEIIAHLPHKLKRVNAADPIPDVFTQVQKVIDLMIDYNNKNDATIRIY